MFFYLAQYALSVVLLVLLTLLLVLRAKFFTNERNSLEPPSPFKIPIIGHLHLLSWYNVPYEAFTHLGKKFGDVVQLQLGFVKCVAINGSANIREILVTKGHHFDSRPNFERYQMLFCGNKENSLAFCNWSNTQKARRDMLKTHTFPRASTHKFSSLEELISEGTSNIIQNLNGSSGESVSIKPSILQNCADIFTQHFCTKKFDLDDSSFVEMVNNFDDIFFEVNQGYAADFLPFLMPFHKKNLKRMNGLTHKIRDFFTQRIIENRFDDLNVQDDPQDYVESLIKAVKNEELPELSWDSALFALEDIIGGHSAVGNFLVKLLAFLVSEPEVQRKIQQEIDDAIGDKQVAISDRSRMPYTEATIFEAIRLIASPIVPRVANQDSSIKGYKIEKGTVIFLNNHDLSMSEKLWEEPDAFKPERFIREGRLFKPEHFLPFGGGRRSCMGYKMVQLLSFGILGGLLQKFTILPARGQIYKVPVGSLALPKDTFQFRFEKR